MTAPGWLDGLVMSGALPAAALILLAIETLVVVRLRRRIAPGVLANALAGASLLAALLCALLNAGAIAIAAALFVALIGHLADLKLRLGQPH